MSPSHHKSRHVLQSELAAAKDAVLALQHKVSSMQKDRVDFERAFSKQTAEAGSIMEKQECLEESNNSLRDIVRVKVCHVPVYAH